MNCPKCTTPAAAGATHCKRCGTPLGSKAAAKPSSSDEIDLMPMEESKAPAYSAYEPPPGLDLPGAAAPGLKLGPKGGPGDGPPGPPGPEVIAKIRGANAAPPQSNLTKIIGLGVVGLIVIFIVWRLVRTEDKVIVGKPKFEQFVVLNAGNVRLENIEVTGNIKYKLDIEIMDGEMLVGVVQRSHKDSQKFVDLKKSDGLKTMKKSEKEEFDGEFKHKEQWSWMLLNDTKKPARAKVKFQTEPK